jgi:ATP-binding cassette, subfamily B, bacterial
VLNRWTGVFAGQLDASMRRGRLGAGIGAFTQTIQRFSPLILLWVGAKMVLDGSMTLGSMLAVTALGQQFLTPLANLVTSGQQLQQVGGHLYRVGVVLQAEPEQDLSAVRVAPPLTGAVELEDVCFRYDDSSPWVVRDFSLTVEPGQKVAFVGKTGSGKSTLAKLLLGLHPPTSGSIRFDGHELHDLDLRTVRAQLGVVMQDASVRNGSVRENIADHDDDLPLEDVVRAARVAELHDDIEALPMKYDTVVGEGGGSLSGGQRQRLALARALAQDPVILLLDEATSSLDMETEAKIGARLIEQGRTTFVIAHRLSTIRDADVICVFDAGKEVERGTHEDLIAAGGLYAELVKDQLKARART